MKAKLEIIPLKSFIVLLAAILLCSCHFHEDEFVDFANIEAVKGMAFQVIGQHETDLEHGLPTNCYLPDGTPAYAYTDEQDSEGVQPRKTSSVTGAAILQELLKYGNQNKVTEIVGTYPTIDLNRIPYVYPVRLCCRADKNLKDSSLSAIIPSAPMLKHRLTASRLKACLSKWVTD